MTSGAGNGTRGVPREVREQLLLDAAVEEFGRLGFAGATLSSIAERADVSKTLIMIYFGSKEGLYVACVERAGAALTAAIDAVLAVQQPPAKLAEATLAAIFATLADRPQEWNVINDTTLPADGPGEAAAVRIRRAIADQARAGVATLASLERVHDDADLGLLSSIWMSTVTAIVNWWLRHPECSAEEMTERSTRVIDAITGSTDLTQ